MAIDNDVFRSILSMDSYNRGYDSGIDLTGSSLENASLSNNLSQALDPEATEGTFLLRTGLCMGR
jgi:hypothetical protein